jgi:opacity protein-like surface antigen
MNNPKILIAFFFICLPVSAGAGLSKSDGSFGLLLGQHFTPKITAPGLFPALELKFGYKTSKSSTTRLDLGSAFTKVSDSEPASFNGALLYVGHLSLVFLYSPQVSKNISLNLGGTIGLWFSSLSGEDLFDTMAGSVINYIEQMSVSYGLILGVDYWLSKNWALSAELRGNLAMVKWGPGYNTGGLTVVCGFVYRMRTD